MIDFSQPRKQSAKGILIIFFISLIKFLKTFYLLIIVVFISFLKTLPLKWLFLLIPIFIVLLLFSILKYNKFTFRLSHNIFF